MLGMFRSPLKVEKDNYIRCRKHRETSLLEFRKNAAREVFSLYPDALLLMGSTCDKFLAYSKNNDALIDGVLYDKDFPSLDDVASESVDEYATATSRYKKKLSAYLSDDFHVREELLERRAHRRMSLKDRREMLTKGYDINHVTKADRIIAAKVCINDIVIASTDCVNPINQGELASKVYNSILRGEVRSDNGISVISVSLQTFDYGYIGSSHYEKLFDDRSHFNGDAGFDLFKRNFAAIVEFISAIEGTASSWPKELEGEREVWEEQMPHLVEWR